MKSFPQSYSATNGNKPISEESILKKVKERRQKVYDSINNRSQFTNLAMEYVVENTSFQQVFHILFEATNVTLFKQQYLNFWELGLQKQNITNYKFQDWNLKPPECLDDLEALSNFPTSIERVLQAQKPMKINLPFLPKSIHYKEISRLYILDNTETWFTGESIVLNEVPMSDVFTFKQCIIIKAISDSKVNIQFRWFVEFHKWTLLKGTVISSTNDETNLYASKCFKPALDDLSINGFFKLQKKDDSRSKAPIKKEPDANLLLSVLEESKVQGNSKITRPPNEIITEIPANTTIKADIKDPLDEPIKKLLKEIEERYRKEGPGTSDEKNILRRLHHPEYKGDMIFVSLVILSLAKLSYVMLV